jgi:D-alanyl-D-alanine carboxypeptidase/D-alanyl-D-alanine-endopeptidase (penicillin-binding protein 4)
MQKFLKPWVLASCTLAACLPAHAQPKHPLPAEVQAALTRAHVPTDAVAMLVLEASSKSAPRLSHRANSPMNPASVMKLVTTYAALDLLGPSYTWRTPVWLDGPVVAGTLKGNLVIAGQGDPKLVLERLWLLLRRLQGLGVQRIAGNIVLDRRAFEVPPSNPADFDGEPLRPYNASPDALLVNFKSLVMTFTPDPNSLVARVQIDPPLTGLQLPTQVPLSNGNGCNDYRASLKADFSDPLRIRFNGSYPGACGEKVWPVAYADPTSYNARALEGLWRNMGGQLDGTVLDGAAPATAPTFEMVSPTLAEVIRDINKYSNNVMAQQLFFTLGLPMTMSNGTAGKNGNGVPRHNATPANTPIATLESARQALREWWQRRISTQDMPNIDNGSGLSRLNRISAKNLADLLQAAYLSPNMPELVASLPVVGVDGTLKRSQASHGNAHLKTGSLHDVTALAGYVHAASGKRYVLVAMVNHANANAVRPAFDALIEWAVMDNQGN